MLNSHLEALERAPLTIELILRICDVCVAKGREYDAEYMPGWMKAVAEAGSLLLVKLLADRNPGVMPSPLARKSETCTENGFTRALSVAAALFARGYGEALAQNESSSEVQPYVFAARIAAVIDPFGESFVGWLSTQHERVLEEGGSWEGLEPYYALLGLHVSMWAPSVAQMPPTAEEAQNLLPAPPSEALVNLGSLSYSFEMIQIALAGDFLPRLQESLGEPSS